MTWDGISTCSAIVAGVCLVSGQMAIGIALVLVAAYCVVRAALEQTSK